VTRIEYDLCLFQKTCISHTILLLQGLLESLSQELLRRFGVGNFNPDFLILQAHQLTLPTSLTRCNCNCKRSAYSFNTA
jgi:hypothetical protein